MTRDANDIARERGINALRDSFDRAAIHGSSGAGLVITRASDIKPERVRWLWQDRFPLGKCTLIAGEGGLGKSMVLAWIAATVSRGGAWPCSEGESPKGSVIILSAEDDAADTIIPRLIAADADCSKIYVISAVRREDAKGHRSFNLQLDLPELEKKITEIGDVLLVEIDPITSYLGGVDSHKNAELRSVLEPLGEMAARLGVTVIGNTHLSKVMGGSANSRVIGSVAFVNHARAAFIVSRDPGDKDRRLLIPSKANLGRPQEALGYQIATTTILDADKKLLWAPYVKWEESTIRITADEAVAAMAGDTEAQGARDQAKDFLIELLVDGPVPQKDIKAASEGAGLAWRTVQRAKASLAIEARRENDKWFWRLPKGANQESKMATLRNGALGTLGAFEPSENGEDAKGANFLSGHLEECDGALGDTYPELPAFLDRRARVGHAVGGSDASLQKPERERPHHD
jgi:hypothetical protein